jgi:hypothetical protein
MSSFERFWVWERVKRGRRRYITPATKYLTTRPVLRKYLTPRPPLRAERGRMGVEGGYDIMDIVAKKV